MVLHYTVRCGKYGTIRNDMVQYCTWYRTAQLLNFSEYVVGTDNTSRPFFDFLSECFLCFCYKTKINSENSVEYKAS